MIFHDLKTVFIHVERTGGVSIRKHLLEYETHFRRWPQTKHFSSAEIQNLLQGWDIWNNYFKFAFVRNPYDRLVSWYHACWYHHEWISDIAKYMRNYDSLDLLIHDNKPHSQITRSQYDMTKGIDFIGRFENYEVDIQKICNKIGIPKLNRKENSTKHKHYSVYYTLETRKIVTNWFKKDLEKFNYEF